ncbi:hypothetical protein WMF11_19410 [Sorangium sp. So ce295]|uniref:hypothetical protein n=1 Tax=Sorangium sp. So ce295 TaxID=3133295 RepID=UPI003F603BCA
MKLRTLVASLVLVPAALATGCGAEDTQPEDMLEEVTGSAQQALHGPKFEMPQNGLDPLAVDSNFDLLWNVWQQPLNRSGFAHTLSTTVSLPDNTPVDIPSLFGREGPAGARYLMAEIVSCALDPNQKLVATIGGVKLIWNGEFGLCGAESPFGNWGETSATDACRGVVSACLLARMNALGRHVPISMRFPGHLPAPKVRAQTTLRDGTTIGGFAPCDPNDAEPTGNCGWKADFVGICQRNQSVTLQRNGAFRVRVCKGIHGCGYDPQIASSFGRAPYAGFVHEFDVNAMNDPITFTCPDDVAAAPLGEPTHAYFSVMVAPAVREGNIPKNPTVQPICGAVYPAAEREVFTYPEGAFYGNVFPTKDDGVDRFACYSELWEQGVSYLADRLCADPDANSCLSVAPPACQDVCGHRSRPGEAYSNCENLGSQDPEDAWPWPGFTVFLNDPRDLSSGSTALESDPTLDGTSDDVAPDSDLSHEDRTLGDSRPRTTRATAANNAACSACSHPVCTTGTPLTNECGPIVTSICAVDPFCCNTAWDDLCVNEVQSVANDLQCVAGACAHKLCTEGAPLTSGCDVPPLAAPGCVTSICAVDSFCCDVVWDNLCVDEVQTVCGKTCN